MQYGFLVVSENPLNKLKDLAKRAEDAGFDTLWIGDERFHRDVWVSLSASAGATRRIRLGTLVTDPYVRHPALTAVAIQSVDELSNGRAVLGLGAGISGGEQLCILRDRPALAVREAISLIRRLFRGEEISFEGKTVKTKGLKLSFQPRPDLEIYLAARGSMMLEIAGELADGAVIASVATPPGIRYSWDLVKKGEAKRDPGLPPLKIVSYTYCAIDEDRDLAYEKVKPGVVLPVVTSKPFLTHLGFDPDELKPLLDIVDQSGLIFGDEVHRRACEKITPRMIENFSVSGTPEDVARKIKTIADMGVGELILFPFPQTSEAMFGFVDIFHRRVRPLLEG